jgi:DNA-binding response OmpR family regulator
MMIRGENTIDVTEKTVRTILVVDDDPAVTRAMSYLMTRAGFRPIISRTGADALKKADTRISAAVIDIHLPDINGLTLSQQLRETLGPKVPIVILSGDNSIETLRALPDAGATSFFAKPVNAARLIAHLTEWLAPEETS